LFLEALQAVHRSIFNWPEGNLGLSSAFSAYGAEHLTALAIARIPALCSAFPTALGLILKPLLVIEFLLTSGEYKLLPTILAY